MISVAHVGKSYAKKSTKLSHVQENSTEYGDLWMTHNFKARRCRWGENNHLKDSDWLFVLWVKANCLRKCPLNVEFLMQFDRLRLHVRTELRRQVLLMHRNTSKCCQIAEILSSCCAVSVKMEATICPKLHFIQSLTELIVFSKIEGGCGDKCRTERTV